MALPLDRTHPDGGSSGPLFPAPGAGPRETHPGTSEPRPAVSYDRVTPVVFGRSRVRPPVLNGGPAYIDEEYWARDTDGVTWVKRRGVVGPIVYALCEAPPAGAPAIVVHSVWREREGVTLTDLYRLLGATDAAHEWVLTAAAATWADLYPVGAAGLAWRGLAQFRARRLAMPDGKIPPLEFEISGLSIAAGETDAHPMDVLLNLLTTARPGWRPYLASQVEVDRGPDGELASGGRRYCDRAGWRVARTIADPTNVRDLVDSLLEACNCASIESEGKFKVVPLEARPIGAAPDGYAPPATAAIIDDDEIITRESRVEAKTTPSTSVYNAWPIVISSRASYYRPVPYRFELAGHAAGPRGLRIAAKRENRWIVTPQHAMKLSQLLALRSVYNRNTYRGIVVGPRWGALEPGDLVTFSYGRLGISGKKCRIIAIDGRPRGRRELTLEEWPDAIASPIDLTPQPHDGLASITVGSVHVDGAQTSADAALADLARVAADGWLSRGEKPQYISAYASLIAERDAATVGLNAQADTLGVSRSDYNAKLTALTNYLISLTPAWDLVTEDTALIAAAPLTAAQTWSTRWAEAYAARTALLANLAATRANKDLGNVDVGAGNLLRNSSFEVDSNADGLADYWVGYNNTQGTQPATWTLEEGGRYGGRFQRISWSIANTSTKGIVTANAAGGGVPGGWVANRWYTISVWVKGSLSGGAANHYIGFGWNSAPNDVEVVKCPAIVNGGDWQQYAFRIRWTTSPVETYAGALHISLSGSATGFVTGDGATGWLGFDAISVVEGRVLGAYAPRAEEVTSDANARSRNAIARPLEGVFYYRGMSVGPPVLMDYGWAPAPTVYAVGDRVVAGAGVYICIVGGLSGNGVNGPWPSTGTNIACDGTVPGPTRWNYIGTVASQERLKIANLYAFTINSLFFYRVILRMRPMENTDNLDAMENVIVDYYDSGGTYRGTVAAKMPSRKYAYPASANNLGNEVALTIDIVSTIDFRNGTAMFAGYFRVNMANALGATVRDYGPGLAFNTQWTGGASVPGLGGAPAPSGDPVGGGECPAPETLILLPGGLTKPAGEMRAGDNVWTLPEDGGTWGAYEVSHASVHHGRRRVRAVLCDGRTLPASPQHRVRGAEGWRHVMDLQRGERLWDGGVVDRVDEIEDGPVVLITVPGARTYVAGGILSHNAKKAPP